MTKKVIARAESDYGSAWCKYLLGADGRLRPTGDWDWSDNLAMFHYVHEVTGLTLEEAREKFRQVIEALREQERLDEWPHIGGCHMCTLRMWLEVEE